MYKGINKQRKIKLKNAVCKLDFIDFEKACDILANYLDFFALIYEKMPYAIKEYTPTYEYTRALLGELLHNEETSVMFKYITLDYLKNFYYENKIKDNLDTRKNISNNIIRFKK